MCGIARMMKRVFTGAAALAFSALLFSGAASRVGAQTGGPTVLDPNLEVRTVVADLSQPTTMAFLGPDDFLVLEKNTGRVKRVVGGVVQAIVLDLAVNSASERGLLGIALHPNFPANPGVYLYWTCTAPAPADPTFPTLVRCPDVPAPGPDTSNIAAVPLLGNRVDRFAWDGSALTFDRHLISLRSYQADWGQPLRGNHNGGVIRFGPDGKLYVIIGDNGRRGQLQNLPAGPTLTGLGDPVPDDQFGGPEPDDAHLTGVILRLNDDGSAPTDNPFYAAGAAIGGEVGRNLQKVFAYGVRNSFGLAFDPRSGNLWESQNGDDSFGEINRVEAGANSGWVQIMGPVSRVAEFKQIELSLQPLNSLLGSQLQQVRWPAERIADTPGEALSRLFMLPGSRYIDPELSWRYEVSPTAIGFLDSGALGPQYEGDMFVGGANAPPQPNLAGGFLFRIELTGDRRSLAVAEQDPRLADRVADNNSKYDVTESESLLFGRDFGGVTDIQRGPNGNLFVVSVTRQAVYEIRAAGIKSADAGSRRAIQLRRLKKRKPTP